MLTPTAEYAYNRGMTTTIEIPTTPQGIASDRRFIDGGPGAARLFDLLADKIGRDKAGVLWIQACLYFDQA